MNWQMFNGFLSLGLPVFIGAVWLFERRRSIDTARSKLFFFYLIILGMFGLLAGCAGMTSVSRGDHFPDKGIIAFRLACTLENGKECNPKIWMTREGSEIGVKMAENRENGLYMVKARPGRYQWKRIHYFTKAGFQETILRYKIPSFEVNANEVVYLGDFHLTVGEEPTDSDFSTKTDNFAPLILAPFSPDFMTRLSVKDESEEVSRILSEYLDGVDYKFTTRLLKK